MNKLFTKLSLGLSLLLLVLLFSGCESTPQQMPNTEQSITTNALPAQPGQLTPSQQVEYRYALAALGNNDHKQGIKLLNRLNKKGAFSAVKRNLALAYYKSEQLEQAETLLGEGLALNANDAQLYNLAGLIKLDKHDFGGAEQAFVKAVSLDKNYALAYYNLALLYDIYYQEIKTAYSYYLTYLNLIEYKDEQTMDWVEQLKYSVGDE